MTLISLQIKGSPFLRNNFWSSLNYSFIYREHGYCAYIIEHGYADFLEKNIIQIIYNTLTLEQTITDSWAKLLKIEIITDCVYTRF